MTMVPADKVEIVNRALTGPLGAWETTRLPDAIASRRPPPPPWARSRAADIERLERARAAAAVTES